MKNKSYLETSCGQRLSTVKCLTPQAYPSCVVPHEGAPLRSTPVLAANIRLREKQTFTNSQAYNSMELVIPKVHAVGIDLMANGTTNFKKSK